LKNRFVFANHAILMKKPLQCLVLLLACTSVRAANNPEDSLLKLWNPPIISTQTVILQQANVVYPEMLRGNEEKTVSYIEKFSNARRSYLIRTYHRGKKFFPKANQILSKYNVPQEFSVLLALESGFNPKALSRAGAYGYWQLMDEVAKEYGLKISGNHTTKEKSAKKLNGKHAGKNKQAHDQRSDFVRSTHVAARYLQDRIRNLGNDWLLIAASYNWGVGNVWNAIQRTGKKDANYWDIEKYVPSETRAYVLNFITLNVIFNNYEKFEDNKLCFKTITEEQPCILDEKEAVDFTWMGYLL